MLQHLNDCNAVPIYSILEDRFHTYGKVWTEIDVTGWADFMREYTEIPATSIYLASDEKLESFAVVDTIRDQIYGQNPIQVGYCNGHNHACNGFEFHKGSEVLVAVSDLMLILGHRYDMVHNTYHTKNAEVFYLPKGSMVELYQTTLHLAPCAVDEEGYRVIVVLPEGTNTPLKREHLPQTEESQILTDTNKWIIAHPDYEPLTRHGIFAGVEGENLVLRY